MQSIRVENLSFSYGNKGSQGGAPVLEGISFAASGDGSIGLIGANGAGKSTLLKLLAGLEEGYSGSMEVNGLSVEKKNLAAIRRGLGYVFQDSGSQLFMPSVYEDVAFAPRSYGLSQREIEERAQSALEKAHIAYLADRPIYKLSGGEKKLAAIAGILPMEPGILLMDEPTAALDPRNRRRLIQLMKELPGLKLIATHDLDMALAVCGRAILMSNGRIACDGNAEEILSNQALLEAHGLELPLCLSGRP